MRILALLLVVFLTNWSSIAPAHCGEQSDQIRLPANMDTTDRSQNRVQLSDDGKTLYCLSNCGRKRMALARIRFNADGTPGPLEFIASRPMADASAFVMDDQGSAMAVCWHTAKGEDQVSIINLSDESSVLLTDLPAWTVRQISISHDGKTLAVAGDEHDIWTMDVATKRWREHSAGQNPLYTSNLPRQLAR